MILGVGAAGRGSAVALRGGGRGRRRDGRRGRVQRLAVRGGGLQRRGADGDSFQRVFVHFKHWPDHPEVTRIREKLLRGDEIKLVYNEPWFWKLFLYKSS